MPLLLRINFETFLRDTSLALIRRGLLSRFSVSFQAMAWPRRLLITWNGMRRMGDCSNQFLRPCHWDSDFDTRNLSFALPVKPSFHRIRCLTNDFSI
jgi:hypothetical protein